MGKSFKWASLKDATPLDVDKTFFGPIGVVNGTDYDGHEGIELARDFADLVKKDDIVSFFAPSLDDALKVDGKGKKDPTGYNFLGSTLKAVVDEGVLEPVIMGKWIRTKAGNSFPQPYLAFFAPPETVKATKAVTKKTKGRFARK